MDLQAGDQRKQEFLALNPNGKMPVLEMDDGSSLWESNAIIDRLAAHADSDIWPKSNQRYDIMRWQFWEGCHFTPACSNIDRRRGEALASTTKGNASGSSRLGRVGFMSYVLLLPA